MRSRTAIAVATAAIFALFHLIVVAVPIVAPGASGQTQAFAVATFDLPLFWLPGLSAAGRAVLCGSSPLLYTLVFVIGGTLQFTSPFGRSVPTGPARQPLAPFGQWLSTCTERQTSPGSVLICPRPAPPSRNAAQPALYGLPSNAWKPIGRPQG
jgi:hypothetical protein